MFDERNEKWIGIYRKYIIIMFWVYVLAAIVTCICGWCWVFWMTDSPFLDGIICLALGLLAAYIHLVCNMVILNFVANVQAIREVVEDMCIIPEISKAIAGSAGAAQVLAECCDKPDNGMWGCKNCGTQNSVNYSQCKKCGSYKA